MIDREKKNMIDREKKNMIDREKKNMIESLLYMNNEKIKSIYNSWDKGDCSIVGLIEILLFQEIENHKQINGEYYDTDYDEIKLRIK